MKDVHTVLRFPDSGARNRAAVELLSLPGVFIGSGSNDRTLHVFKDCLTSDQVEAIVDRYGAELTTYGE